MKAEVGTSKEDSRETQGPAFSDIRLQGLANSGGVTTTTKLILDDLGKKEFGIRNSSLCSNRYMSSYYLLSSLGSERVNKEIKEGAEMLLKLSAAPEVSELLVDRMLRSLSACLAGKMSKDAFVEEASARALKESANERGKQAVRLRDIIYRIRGDKALPDSEENLQAEFNSMATDPKLAEVMLESLKRIECGRHLIIRALRNSGSDTIQDIVLNKFRLINQYACDCDLGIGDHFDDVYKAYDLPHALDPSRKETQSALYEGLARRDAGELEGFGAASIKVLGETFEHRPNIRALEMLLRWLPGRTRKEHENSIEAVTTKAAIQVLRDHMTNDLAAEIRPLTSTSKEASAWYAAMKPWAMQRDTGGPYVESFLDSLIESRIPEKIKKYADYRRLLFEDREVLERLRANAASALA